MRATLAFAAGAVAGGLVGLVVGWRDRAVIAERTVELARPLLTWRPATT